MDALIREANPLKIQLAQDLGPPRGGNTYFQFHSVDRGRAESGGRGIYLPVPVGGGTCFASISDD
jgi:hypothetical protein